VTETASGGGEDGNLIIPGLLNLASLANEVQREGGKGYQGRIFTTAEGAAVGWSKTLDSFYSPLLCEFVKGLPKKGRKIKGRC